MRENKQLRKLDTPRAFLTRPHVGHSKAEYATCVASDPVWVITTASQAWYAMCVGFCPQVSHHDSFASWSTPCASLLSPCGRQRASVRTSLHFARTRGGERDGEHAQAAVVNAGGPTGPCRTPLRHCGPTPPSAKWCASHSHSSPSIIHSAARHEIWKKLHVGGINGISCQHLQVMATNLLQKHWEWPEEKAPMLKHGSAVRPTMFFWQAWTSIKTAFDEGRPRHVTHTRMVDRGPPARDVWA